MFWDSENQTHPDGSPNFQTREYPVGYTPEIPAGAVWPPTPGTIWPGDIPAEYVEPSNDIAAEPEPAPEPEVLPELPSEPMPEPPAIDPFALSDEELDALTQ
jgi:hypothetical protein